MLTELDELKRLPQTQYDKLLSRLAGAIQTRRSFITVVGVERKTAAVTRYKVKRQGEYYPYLVEETLTHIGYIYLNLGLVI